MIVTHEVGRSITAQAEHRELPTWVLDYGSKPKPFMHPVRTPNGHCLSLAEPYDHLWHRGLWFTFKYVNGENFWEENVEHGIQRVTAIPAVCHTSENEIAVEMELAWCAPKAGEPVFVEHRTIRYRPGQHVDTYDWRSSMVAQQDVVLDRTPYTTWGGYGGLSFRGSRNWAVERYLLPDGAAQDRPTGQRGSWCELSGRIDGGAGLSGGIAILDHPGNLRAPTPWYAGGGSGTFINAALLFHEPLTLVKGEELSLRYRVLIHDGIWERDQVEEEHETFASNDEPGMR